MKLGRQFVFVAASLLLFSASCAKKPSQLPTQAKVPAETVPSSLPPEISEETPPPPLPAEPKQEEAPPEQPKPKPAQHKKKKPTPPTEKSTTPAATAQNSAPASASSSATSNTTTVAAAHPPANPATEAAPDTAISAGVTSAQLSQQKQTTAQLLDETEKTLNGLNRTLTHDEEGIVAQIRSYMGQSRNATKDGDFERAYNLATKAHLLSDALGKK